LSITVDHHIIMSGRTRKIGKGKGPRKNKPARARALILGDRRSKLLDTVAKLVAETEKRRMELLVCEQQIVSLRAEEEEEEDPYAGMVESDNFAGRFQEEEEHPLAKCDYCGETYQITTASCMDFTCNVCPDAECVQEYADDAFEGEVTVNAAPITITTTHHRSPSITVDPKKWSSAAMTRL
jgi:hypothetical protein